LKKLIVAVVGATGLVGREIVKILDERNISVTDLRLFASEKSAGELISFHEKKLTVKKLHPNSFAEVDFALFSAGAKVSSEFAPVAVKSGCIVIDNSKTFRMVEKVPLIVPEINAHLLSSQPKLIANPNCSTIQMVVALKPIYDCYGISRIVISTYQAVSGTGKKAIVELNSQTASVLANLPIKKSVYPYQIAFNCLPQIDEFSDNGFTLEEMKLVNETRKILNDETIQINATAVRVPVIIGHCESVYIECKKQINISEILELLNHASGVKVMDKLQEQMYPLAIHTEFDDHVLVGRIRADLDKKNAFNMWIAANNLRKGAALNAVQILEECLLQ
jgi:aspartate-semialdehyde dehydrogenase